MFIWSKIALFFKLLKRPKANIFNWFGVAAVILFVFGLNFALSFQAKAFLSGFKGGFGAGTEETINSDLPLSDDSSFDSFSCFLNPKLSFPPVFIENQEEIAALELGGDTIFGYRSPLTFFSSANLRDGVTVHKVAMGENPWTIAAKYGVSPNTVLWANNMSSWQYVKVDQELVILPVSGVRHKVVKGDTVEKIAKKYKAEAGKIIVFNNLPPDSPELEAGEYLIVPDGEMPAPPAPKYIPTSYTTFAYGEALRRGAYAVGHCTWYVAQKRADIPTNWGNAKNWLNNALAAGYAVCQGRDCTPQRGAIISLNDSGWMARLWGHVAYIEEVNGNQITISEMNHVGRYRVNNRNLSIGDKKIKGYIY